MIATTALVPTPIKAIALRDYQKGMIAQTYGLIRQGIRKVLQVAIMGAGKTVIGSSILRDAVSKGKRCVFLVSLNVLLDQTAETLQDMNIHCTVLQGDRPVDESAPVIVASLQTIAARLRKGKSLGALLGNVDVFVVDEAHITAFHDAYDAIEQYFQSSAFIGLTATPWRLSKKEWLGQKFDALVEGPQPPEIIQRGSALPCRGFTLTGALDLDKLQVRNGDYIDSQIASQACKPEALAHVVNEHRRLCGDRPTLTICATVEQARMTCDRFNAEGVTAELVVGSTAQEERRAIFERVKAGKTQVICSVGCLTAGFNLPAISAILYVRATKSKALFYQSAGRGSRPSPGKSDYLLLDFGGNLKRFGNPMGWQTYDISQPIREEEVLPTKTCPGCSAEITVFAQVCPHCGFEFTGDALSDEQQEELILAELNEFIDKFSREKIRSLRKWRKLAYLGDRSPDSAIEQFASEYGHTPPPEWLMHTCLTKRYSQRRKQAFIDYLERHCNMNNRWVNQWIGYHLRLEFGTSDIETIDPFTEWWQILECNWGDSWEQVKRAYARKLEQFAPHVYNGIDRGFRIEQLNLALEDAKADYANQEVAQ